MRIINLEVAQIVSSYLSSYKCCYKRVSLL